MTKHKKDVEILAPCGSYDILVAAVRAGADACYIGGNKFGARAYAANFDTDSIIRAIDYAHVHDAKIYLTINTLFKNKELDTLYEYLLPFYMSGLDAVIIQDLGVFKYVREVFPDISVHCSTQMNVTSRHAAEYMKKLGAQRIVTARELSLDEIREIKDNVDIEIEAFVHGAMCYSYSGQCMLSSAAGSRSGNRGRCAQPCRKCYDGRYLLSMKDMCALELIPQIIEAGVDSLKIEGRMKNEYYVASAVDAYRELSRDYFDGCFSHDKAEKLKFRLANIYNRGGFTDGYFYKHNGADMISAERPNNNGVVLGQLTGINNGSIDVRLATDMYKGDVLELRLKDGQAVEITSGADGNAGGTVSLKAPKTRMLKPKQTVLRTRCNKIIEDVENNIISSDKRPCLISGSFSGRVGEPMRLELVQSVAGRQISITKTSDNIIEPSDNRPADRKSIASKLSQLGNTDYSFDKLEINIDDNSFIPLGELKKLRRSAIELLRDRVCELFRRTKVENKNIICPVHNERFSPEYMLGVSDIAQLRVAADYGAFHGVYISAGLYDSALEEKLTKKLAERGVKIYIALPFIIHNDFNLNNYLPKNGIDGIYIRNIDGLAAYKRAALNDSILYDMEVICGFGLYGYNDLARAFISGSNNNIVLELPKELTVGEMSGLSGLQSMLAIYEYQQVMLSAQCVFKTQNKCSHGNENIKITDDKGNSFCARAICDECCNVLYNGTPFLASKQLLEDIKACSGLKYYSINFTTETPAQVDKLMNILAGSDSPNEFVNECRTLGTVYTNAHCYRGVD